LPQKNNGPQTEAIVHIVFKFQTFNSIALVTSGETSTNFSVSDNALPTSPTQTQLIAVVRY